MNIALIGYGKMGKAIEKIALENGHQIVVKIDVNNEADFIAENIAKADVAIEFTGPHSAVDNIKKCLTFGIPVVSGSTGWLEKWEEIVSFCTEKKGCFVYASNYSIGVNLFFEVNKYLAKLMNDYADYNISLSEIHHTEKKDAPSGTAISLAEQILESVTRKKGWTNSINADDATSLNIFSERIDPAPGTHKIKYSSEIDDIEIIHTAHNRIGFAGGAVKAAEFSLNKKGVFGMKEVLGLL